MAFAAIVFFFFSELLQQVRSISYLHEIALYFTYHLKSYAPIWYMVMFKLKNERRLGLEVFPSYREQREINPKPRVVGVVLI